MEQANANLGSHIKANPYPGRGLVVGLSESGNEILQVYWIMGRSENSRNRVFCADKASGRLWTEAADPSKMKDPSLIIYNAMLEHSECFVVSNGDQTNTVIDFLKDDKTSQGNNAKFVSALNTREFEPDAPNFTPRITGMVDLSSSTMSLAILKQSTLAPSQCSRHYFHAALPTTPGLGLCLTTYHGDGNPLPSFSGEPLLLPLRGDVEGVADEFWNSLDNDNKVSLAVKAIDIKTRKTVAIAVRNKLSQQQ